MQACSKIVFGGSVWGQLPGNPARPDTPSTTVEPMWHKLTPSQPLTTQHVR